MTREQPPKQLVLHAGAHFTETDRLLKSLLRNHNDLARMGVAVPGPGRYRRLLRDALNAMSQNAPAADAREILLDAILDDDSAHRMVLSNPHFFGSAQIALQSGVLYPKAAEKLRRFTHLFAPDKIELFLALRNPASFMPTVFQKMETGSVRALLGAADPLDIRWSDLILDLHEAAPHVTFRIWCNEDAPLIWANIIRSLAGIEDDRKIFGGFDLLSTIMSKEGMLRFRAYLKSHPVMSEAQKRRVITAFLDKFALDDAIEEELNMPGLNDGLVSDMTEIYEADVAEIQTLPGVTLIQP
ncbi:MAG: hypothetical protein AAF754_01580 [Pseudomonadota bacterium]